MGALQMMEDMQGLGLLFMDEGVRCEGFMIGRIKNGAEALTHRRLSLGTGFYVANSF